MKRIAFVVSAWLPIAIAGLVVSAPAADPGVTVQLFKFRPERLEVKAGARVTWTNQDEITHTVTSGKPGQKAEGFDLRLGGKGSSGTIDFPKAGTYPFFCERHPAMFGEVYVTQ